MHTNTIISPVFRVTRTFPPLFIFGEGAALFPPPKIILLHSISSYYITSSRMRRTIIFLIAYTSHSRANRLGVSSIFGVRVGSSGGDRAGIRLDRDDGQGAAVG